jgi:hypothetical protein
MRSEMYYIKETICDWIFVYVQGLHIGLDVSVGNMQYLKRLQEKAREVNSMKGYNPVKKLQKFPSNSQLVLHLQA